MKKYPYICEKTFECEPIHVKLRPGSYLIECYGAQGGMGLTDGSFEKSHPGGKGAYTSGILTTRTILNVYLYIGGMGENAEYKKRDIIHGGWNGGGDGMVEYLDDDDSGAGGGSTDIRLIPGLWNDNESLKSRIMVAAGGSGSAYRSFGAPGGDLHGYIINAIDSEEFVISNTNQENGYLFGVGQNGENNGDTKLSTPLSGGGGGYYGGYIKRGSNTNSGYNAVSSSGSSFVSGYENCKAITKDGVTSNSNIHYSGISFKNAIIVNGFSQFPSFDQKGYEAGHEGNGAIRITLLTLDTCQCNQNIKFSLTYLSIVFFSKK